jgi:hypothetical protein
VMLIRTGAVPFVWDQFLPSDANLFNSQEWVSECVGPDCPYWDDADGVYRLEREDTPGSGLRPHEPLPDNARVVFTVGSEHKAYLPAIKAAYPWLAEHRA